MEGGVPVEGQDVGGGDGADETGYEDGAGASFDDGRLIAVDKGAAAKGGGEVEGEDVEGCVENLGEWVSCIS